MRIFTSLFLLAVPLYSFCQTIGSAIALDSSHSLPKPDRFYVCDVVDSRTDKSMNNFRLGSPGDKNSATGNLTLDKAMLLLFNQCLSKDTSLVPVVIEIKQFSVHEKEKPAWPADELKIEYRYHYVLEEKNNEFAFYSFSQELYKYMKAPAYLSELFSREFPLAIKGLNEFINQTFDSYPYRGIRVQSSMLRGTDGLPDTLNYLQGRRLIWRDFKGSPDPLSKASAETGSGFNYSTSENIRDGCLWISVMTRCFFLTRKSWVKQALASDDILRHEQLHFDINYLGTLKFADSVAKAKFSVHNWQNELDALNQAIFREITTVQQAYDLESDYGRNRESQEVWQTKIKRSLKENLP